MAFAETITYTSASSLNFDATKVEVASNTLRLLDLGGGSYTTTPQKVSTQHQNMISSLTSFTESVSLGAGSTVKYQLVLNAVAYWHNGTIWVVADGTSATTNLASEINTHVSTLFSDLNLLVPQYLTFNIWLTGTASTRPVLTSNNFNYTFVNGNPATIRQCLIYGYLSDLIGGNPIPSTLRPITFEVQSACAFFHTSHFVMPFTKTASFDTNGYFQISVIETATPGMKLNFFFRYYDGISVKSTRLYSAIVPNTPTLPISQITIPENVDFG